MFPYDLEPSMQKLRPLESIQCYLSLNLLKLPWLLLPLSGAERRGHVSMATRPERCLASPPTPELLGILSQVSGEETQKALCVSTPNSKQPFLPAFSQWPGSKSNSFSADGGCVPMQLNLVWGTLVLLAPTAAPSPGFSNNPLGCSWVTLLFKCRRLSLPFWGFVLWAPVSTNRDFGGEYQEGKKLLKYETILLPTNLIKSVSLGIKQDRDEEMYDLSRWHGSRRDGLSGAAFAFIAQSTRALLQACHIPTRTHRLYGHGLDSIHLCISSILKQPSCIFGIDTLKAFLFMFCSIIRNNIILTYTTSSDIKIDKEFSGSLSGLMIYIQKYLKQIASCARGLCSPQVHGEV